MIDVIEGNITFLLKKNVLFARYRSKFLTSGKWSLHISSCLHNQQMPYGSLSQIHDISSSKYRLHQHCELGRITLAEGKSVTNCR